MEVEEGRVGMARLGYTAAVKWCNLSCTLASGMTGAVWIQWPCLMVAITFCTNHIYYTTFTPPLPSPPFPPLPLAQLSYFSSSPTLANSSLFPSFFRLDFNEEIRHFAQVSFIKSLNYTNQRVGVFLQDLPLFTAVSTCIVRLCVSVCTYSPLSPSPSLPLPPSPGQK